MRIAYFDCFAGVSGDMILGALVDAGLPLSRLQAQLDKLGIAGLRLEAEPVRRLSVAGTRVGVRLADLPVAPEHEHHLDLSADPTGSSGRPARPQPLPRKDAFAVIHAQD